MFQCFFGHFLSLTFSFVAFLLYQLAYCFFFCYILREKIRHFLWVSLYAMHTDFFITFAQIAFSLVLRFQHRWTDNSNSDWKRSMFNIKKYQFKFWRPEFVAFVFLFFWKTCAELFSFYCAKSFSPWVILFFLFKHTERFRFEVDLWFTSIARVCYLFQFWYSFACHTFFLNDFHDTCLVWGLCFINRSYINRRNFRNYK